MMSGHLSSVATLVYNEAINMEKHSQYISNQLIGLYTPEAASLVLDQVTAGIQAQAQGRLRLGRDEWVHTMSGNKNKSSGVQGERQHW